MHTLYKGAFWVLASSIAACSDMNLDERLEIMIETNALTSVGPEPMFAQAKVDLGRLLFFDKELSGNRDTSCASCHHPALGTGDALPLSIGTGGTGFGSERKLGDKRSLIPRNAPEIFNRGHEAWNTMFWDMRVSKDSKQFYTPAGEDLLLGIENIVAAQAMFPVTSRDEMRGAPGDVDGNHALNEIAAIADDDLPGIWSALMDRLLSIEDYAERFNEVFPGRSPTFADAANAIAAFEIQAFTLNQSPWDRYLDGSMDALTDRQKEGALLFFGDAGCGHCHSGVLLTDQKAHNICAPQLGPGKGDSSPEDRGRWLETEDSADLYAFRTPPLRNVAVTGPWMHDGSYTTLEATVRHHLDPETAVKAYDHTQLPEVFSQSIVTDPEVLRAMLDSMDPLVETPRALSDEQIDQIIAFLHALTDPRAHDGLPSTIPLSVPSGLPLDAP